MAFDDTNAFTITIASSGPTTPIEFNGTIPNRNTYIGAVFSLATAQYFSGTQTPFTYAITAGTLPDGLTLGVNDGIISGTPTTEELQSGLVVTGTDQDTDTAASNTFSINVAAEAPVSGSLTDTKFNALRGAGHTGAMSDMLLQWLNANTVVQSKTIPDGWHEYLDEKLVSATGDHSTDWFNYLRQLGYLGQMNDMEIQFWGDL